MSKQVAPETNPAKEPVKPTAHFAGTHEQIARALSIAEFGVPAQAQPRSQGGVLIETGRDRLTLSTFDFQTAVSVTVPVETPVAKGYSLLDFAELKKALSATVAGETKKVAARTPVALAGDLLATEHIALPITTLDIHEFTHPPEATPAVVTVDAQHFLAQLNRVLRAAGRDDTLPALTGVQMTLEGEKLTMTATDRYRCAVAEVPTTPAVKTPEEPMTTHIPGDVLGRLVKSLKFYDGLMGIGIVEGGVARTTLSMGDTTITMRSLEDRLPDLKALFPTECDLSVQIDRAAVVRAAKKCQALIKAKGENGAPVAFAWHGDKISLAPRIGTADDQARTKGMAIPSVNTHGSADVMRGRTLAFNPAFLLDALGTFTSDTLTLHLGRTVGPKPVLLTEGAEMAGAGYQHLLVPVRLAE